ncbi:MAG: hypothetical protein HYX49_09940 [Chloroflexi bacterium]|nr:hypothetical protein [Chloroflexota bacterium]
MDGIWKVNSLLGKTVSTRRGRAVTSLTLALSFLLAACGATVVIPTVSQPATATETETATATPTETVTATPTSEILNPIKIVTNLEQLSQADVVRDGEEAEYAKRVLAAYKNGQIENFSKDVAPAVFDSTDNSRFRNKYGYGSDFGFNIFDYNLRNFAERPLKSVTLVQDGDGGYRVIQIWLQKGRSVGIVWYHMTKDALKSEMAPYVVKYLFEDSSAIILPNDFKNEKTCRASVRDASFCKEFMSEENIAARNKIMEAWVKNGTVPEEIQNGQIQFFPGGTGV